LLLQQLPANAQADKEERAGQWQHITALAQTLRDEELLGLDNSTLLHRLYHQESVRLFAPESLRYQCSCSRERTAGALLAIGREQVEEILSEDGEVSMTCEFCGTHYSFSEAEVMLLLNERGSTLTH
jgi:molecular chaperone Hsp33